MIALVDGWKVATLEQSKREAELKIRASLIEDNVLVSSQEDIEGLSSRGYGVSENGKLMLAFYESLFLLSRGILVIENKKTGKEVTFPDLLKRFQLVKNENAWVKYLIYRDLRSRGYVVREGFGLGIDFRVYERGEYGKEIAKYLIFGIQEGQPVSVEDLARALSYVQSLKKKLVLAVINRRGEVVHYSLSQLNLK